MNKLDETLLRAVADGVMQESEAPKRTERKRIEAVVSRLEDILKRERNKEGRLAGMVARSFGGTNEAKAEKSPGEPVPSGVIGQIESLLEKLLKTNEAQGQLILRLEELL